MRVVHLFPIAAIIQSNGMCVASFDPSSEDWKNEYRLTPKEIPTISSNTPNILSTPFPRGLRNSGEEYELIAASLRSFNPFACCGALAASAVLGHIRTRIRPVWCAARALSLLVRSCFACTQDAYERLSVGPAVCCHQHTPHTTSNRQCCGHHRVLVRKELQWTSGSYADGFSTILQNHRYIESGSPSSHSTQSRKETHLARAPFLWL